MKTRQQNILILGNIPEVGDIFDRRAFTEAIPTSPIYVREPDRFEEELEREEAFSLVLIDIKPYGIEVLDKVRTSRPACPIIMIGDEDDAELILKAKRKGLEAYLIRGADEELFRDLLAEELFTQLKRYVEPPKMVSPSAEMMYRYAQFHNVLEPFFVVAPRRYLLYFNKAGRNLIQVLNDRAPAINAPIDEWVLEGSLEKFKRHLDRAFSGHELVSEQNMETLDEDGAVLREIHYQPVTDPRGQVVAVSIAVHRPAHPELQRARSMQQLTDLAAAISHEHNNLLNVLMSNASLLADRLQHLGDEKALQRLARINKAIERATRFTRQLQALSRTSVSQPEPFNLSELIEEMMDSLKAGTAANIELIADLDSEVPLINADRSHWRRLVQYLIDNSTRNMADDGNFYQIRLRTDGLRVTPLQPSWPVGPGEHVVLEISCDSPAMNTWLYDGRFDPFFVTRQVDRYAGLELASVKSIVEQGGGHIAAEKQGDQTIVQIYYPAAEDPTRGESSRAVTDDPKPQNQSEPKAGDAEEVPALLLVEDEPFLREAFGDVLAREGFDVKTAATVDEALAICDDRDRPLGLLITDVALPEVSGVELFGRLIERWPQLDVIFISGKDLPNIPSSESSKSRQVFLRKPIAIPVLLKTVNKLVPGDER